jgi:hypothetical protein
MPTERESTDIKKAMAYDLTQALDENPEKQQYTPDEIKQLINAYIKGLSQP